MNYQEAMAYLDDIATVGSSYGLDTMRELMRRLGNIQDEMHFIHIAGTNGKVISIDGLSLLTNLVDFEAPAKFLEITEHWENQKVLHSGWVS